MDPILWAAAIAGGVSVVGNVGTFFVAKFGRDAQREQVVTTANVEIARIAAESERIRTERREAARRERGKLYGDALATIVRLENYGHRPRVPSDDEFEQANHDYDLLHQRVFLEGTEAVQEAVTEVTTALFAIGENMGRLGGRSAESFRAAYQEGGRGVALTLARAGLIRAMRDDVTVPHLPASE
jgi:hypothetical protein